MAKREVWQAQARLKAFLEGRGAAVRMVYLPPGEGGAKVGLDDFLAVGSSTDDLFKLASRELPPPPPGEQEGPAAPYEATPEGLVWLKPSQHGVVPTQLTNFTAAIAGEAVEDDGVEQRRRFEIEATLHGRTARFSVSAREFEGMGWVTHQLGAGAILFPGFGLRDQTRAAIQLLSGDIPQRRLYTHLGWRQLDDGDWCYLHVDGATGATGALLGVEVQPPEPLARFRLPDPPEGPELREAIRASLRLAELAPDPVVIPVHAACARAVLGPCDFPLDIGGQTGCCAPRATAPGDAPGFDALAGKAAARADPQNQRGHSPRPVAARQDADNRTRPRRARLAETHRRPNRRCRRPLRPGDGRISPLARPPVHPDRRPVPSGGRPSPRGRQPERDAPAHTRHRRRARSRRLPQLRPAGRGDHPGPSPTSSGTARGGRSAKQPSPSTATKQQLTPHAATSSCSPQPSHQAEPTSLTPTENNHLTRAPGAGANHKPSAASGGPKATKSGSS